MKRKKLLSLLLVLVFTLVMVAGCGSGSSDSGDSKGETDADGDKTIVCWWWGEQEAPGLQDAMNEIQKMFNEADNGLKVELVLQESDTLYTAFRAAAQSNQAPDIQFFWGGTQALEDVWLGNCLPLSDYMDPEEIAHLPKDQASETFWDGKQWGWPFYQLGDVFAYNKEMFKDAGLDPENPPQTWDEFIDACEALKKAGYTPLGFGAKDEYIGGWLVSYFGQQNFDSDEDLIKMVKGETKASDPKNMEWLEKVQELVDKGYVNEDVLSLDLYQGQALLENEQAAMTIHAQSYAASLERSMGKDKIGIMAQPVFGSGKLANSVGIPCQVFTISKDCKDPEAACEFLKFLHTEEAMKLIYDKAAVITPDDRFSPDWLTTEVDKQVEEWKTERPLYWMQYKYPFEYERIGVIPAVQEVLGGTKNAKEAAKILDEALESWRTSAPEQVEAYDKF